MTAQILIIAGCLVLGILGLTHFVYVAATNKFHAHDDQVTTAMQQTSPNITKHTSMWRAWLGFNYSHSLGILWLPLIYVHLALNHMTLLSQSIWLTGLLPIIALLYAVLSKRYWFNIPLVGSLLAFASFAVAFYSLHMA
jgi:hypothetical protein